MLRVSQILLEILFLSTLGHVVSLSSQINCTHLQLKVPKPQLKYMLNNNVLVIWPEDKTAGYKYTAYICCTKLDSASMNTCVKTCPQFLAMTSCIWVGTGPPWTGPKLNSRQCSMKVSDDFEYTVYLSSAQQGCQLKGEKVKIKPSLNIAYPGPVPKFEVYNRQNLGLLIEWTKSFQYVQLLYSLRCKQTALNNITKVITNSANYAPKHYFCCIRVRLPYYGITPYYSEVCKTSQNKAVISSRFRCGNTHECRGAEVDNLSDFAGQLMPDDSNWPKMPPAMVLQVVQKHRN